MLGGDFWDLDHQPARSNVKVVGIHMLLAPYHYFVELLEKTCCVESQFWEIQTVDLTDFRVPLNKDRNYQGPGSSFLIEFFARLRIIEIREQLLFTISCHYFLCIKTNENMKFLNTFLVN